MRCLMFLKASPGFEAGVKPKPEILDEFRQFHDSMVQSGVLLDTAGLQPSSQGVRVRISGTRRIVTDGPFAETKELIAGFWMIQVRSMAEAIEWARRCPAFDPAGESEIEIRQVSDACEFSEQR